MICYENIVYVTSLFPKYIYEKNWLVSKIKEDCKLPLFVFVFDFFRNWTTLNISEGNFFPPNINDMLKSESFI